MNPAELSNLLAETAAAITEILVEAELRFSGNPDEFVTKDYGMLWRVTNCYSLLFKNSGCEKRDTLEKLWASYFSECSIRDAVEELLLVEEKWDEFLLTVDEFMEKKMCSENKNPANEQQISSLSLTRINDNTVSMHIKHIEEQKDSFASLNCDIHVVSFGCQNGALRWQKETGCLFPIWTDSDRHFYKALQFKRSLYQVWRIANMLFYSAELAVGTELPKPFTDYIDDPLQMAGNVIFNQHGKMVFVYACQYPSDRPNVTEMLDVLRNIKT